MKQKSMKNIRKEFREKGIFYTPEELAKKMKSYVDIEDIDIKSIYDPTCGVGSLLSVFPDSVEKYGQELDGEQLALIDLPNFTGYAGDTLMDDGFKDMQFDCIVANPPFSIKWEPERLADDVRFRDCPILPSPSKADWAFLLHILHHLSDDGIAVVLESTGITWRGQNEKLLRKWFVENNYIDRVVKVPGNTFEDTSIETCIIVLKKNRMTTDIVFEDEKSQKLVPYQLIAENGFKLSVNTYLPETAGKKEKEALSTVELTSELRQTTLSTLRNELELDEVLCGIEGISMKPVLGAIKEIVKEFEERRNGGKCTDT